MVSRFALRIIIAAHFGCNQDPLGLVVDDSDVNYPLRDGPSEKLWGGGKFSSRRNFFRYQIPCMNFF